MWVILLSLITGATVNIVMGVALRFVLKFMGRSQQDNKTVVQRDGQFPPMC